MVKLDVKDFYTVGDSHILADWTSRLFEGAERSIVFDVVYFLLEQQFVKWENNTYKVTQGAGIGLLHAGDVADAVFYSMIEKKLVQNRSLERAGTLDWFRFRDDMLILTNGDVTPVRKLISEIRTLADFFVIKTEAVSITWVKFLDVEIRRVDDRLITIPVLKDPGLAKRLTCDSAHPFKVHSSWPRMMMKRVEKLATEAVDVLSYKQELSSQFVKDGIRLISGQPSRVRRAVQPICRVEQVVFWVSLPYHPWWHRLISKAMRSFNCSSELRTLLGLSHRPWWAAQLRSAWNNVLPSTGNLLQV
jgi:hypothetical protein